MIFLKRNAKRLWMKFEKFYTYVLICASGNRTYTGHTSDIEKCLNRHNSGEVLSSKKYRPYEILICGFYETLKEAKARELYFKSSLGRYHLKKVV